MKPLSAIAQTLCNMLMSIMLQKTSSSDESQYSRITDFCSKDERLHDPHIRTLSYHYLWMNKQFSAAETNRVLALVKKHPDQARGEFLVRAVQRQITKEELDSARQAIIITLKKMEDLLQISQTDFIFGNEYTMADSVGTGMLVRLQRLNFSSTIEGLSIDFGLLQQDATTP